MTSSGSPTPKRKFWLPLLGLLSLAVLVVMVLFVYLLLTIPRSTGTAKPASTQPVLSLPTAAPATNTPGPPMPNDISFIAEEPYQGFSDCDSYGFYGLVFGRNDDQLAGIQVAVWADRTGLLALETTDAGGAYRIDLQDRPTEPRLWIQLYRDDVPVSAPLAVEPHVDCHNGFQVYRINWQERSPGFEK